MGDTYTRQSSYTDGDVITAAHTNDEFNQLLAAFAASTGHTHSGDAGEGGPITKLLGNTLTFGAGTAGTDITITFDGETSDGVLKWMEDEDYFEFSDDILIASTEKLQFRDTAIYINSSADGQLDLVADTEIQIAATTVDINGNVDISGTLTIGSAGISEAELEILDGATVTTAELNILDGVTATTAELNILDGVTSTAAELNILDGVTSTAAELNILDGVTSTAAELNILDGVTSTATELNLVDGSSAGTIVNSKAVVYGSSGEVNATTLQIAGTSITSTATELNILDGVTSTAAELNILDGVTSTAAELNILDGVTSTASEINLLDGSNKSTSSITIADSDAFIVIDGNTTKQIPASDITTYIAAADISGVAAGVGLSGGGTSGDVTLTLDFSELSDVTPANGDKLATLDSDGSTEQLTTVASLATLFAGTGLSASSSVISIDAAQTGITSLLATDIKIGEDDQTKIDFETADEIHFYAANAEQVFVADGVFGPQTDSDVDLGTTGVRFKDAFVDSLTVTGDISVGDDLTVEGGVIDLKNTGSQSELRLYCEFSNAHYAALKAPAHSDFSGNTELTLPAVTDTLVGLAATQTLTNKTLTSPKINENVAVTATATEINLLDGVTSTTAELNILDGVTSTAAELNILDGVTSTAAELNILDGVTSTAAELNILDGVTATTAELNILDGVTSTTAELNILDGVTSTAAELNLVDGITAGTVSASKAVIADSNKDVSGFRNVSMTGDLTVAGDDITMATNTAGHLLIADGTNYNPTAVTDLTSLSSIASGDQFLVVDETDGGLKRVTRSVIVSGLAAGSGDALSNVSEDTTPELLAPSDGLLVDVANDITLDADNGNIIFKDGGTTILNIGNNSTDVEFTVSTADKNFKIKGTDGSSAITALDIDMALAGKATFNGDVVIGGGLTVSGTTTTVNSTTVNLNDHNIVLDSGNDTSAVINGAGITIEGGSGDDAKISYNTSGPKFELLLGSSHEDLQVDQLIAASLDISGNVDVDGTLETDALSINGTTVSSTAAELNILDGVTATASELNIMDGVTSTTAELNILDGVTASAADINLIDGITNGTVIASKAIITDSNKDISGGRNITISGELDAATLDISGNADIDGTLETDALSINGTTVTSTAAELNILDGVTSTTAELNLLDGSTAGTVVASKAVVVDSNKDIASFRNVTLTGELDAATLDISGNADIDGTLEADAITVGGTALNTVIAGVTVTDATNAAHVLVTDNESTNENNLITFVEGATSSTGNVGLEMDGNLTYNPSTGRLTATQLAGTLQTAAQTNITSLGTLTSLTVDDITIDGSTISDSGNITIDSGADIILDAAGNDFRFKVAGTEFFRVASSSQDVILRPVVDAKDIIFQQRDGTEVARVEDNGTFNVVTDKLAINGTAITSTAAELNILDGVTSTTAELNILDGATVVVGEINALDLGSTAVGTAIASKAVILDSNKDYTGIRNFTITGELDAATLDISGDADIDGTLEADAITVNGTALDEFISDTTGAMFSSNTETGVTVTYQDSDNTIDVAIDAAQTTITSLLATDIKIGEDDQTKIDFETADEIHFYAANAEQVFVSDGVFGPQTDSDVDLGTTGARFKDAYVDSVTVTGDVAIGDDVTVTGRASGTVTTNTNGQMDLAVSNYFNYTPSADDEIELDNFKAGQSGTIFLDNSGGHAITVDHTILINATQLTAIQTAGKYMLSYFCTVDQPNATLSNSANADKIIMSVSGALT